MIVSYHPPIFAGLKSLTLGTPLQGTLLRCAAAGISVYSPHSALDSVFGGMNDWLTTCIGADPQKVTCLETKPETEAIGGDGRCVMFDPPVSMAVLEGRIKKNLSLSQSRSNTHSVSRYYIFFGSSSGVLAGAPGSPGEHRCNLRWLRGNHV